jgi:hypothetical protein
LDFFIGEEAEVMFGLEEVFLCEIDDFRVVKGDRFLLDGNLEKKLCNVRR